MDNRRSRTHRGRGGTDPPSSSSRTRSSQLPSAPPPNSRTVDCKLWAKGSCRKGAACTYRHASVDHFGRSEAAHSGRTQHQSSRQHTGSESPSYPQGICDHYAATGTCKFGKDCKFSHATDNGELTPEIRPQAVLFQLKGMVKSFSRISDFQTLGHLEDFLDSALRVLDSNERNVQSEAVLVLSRNDLHENDFGVAGYDIIRHIVEQVGKPLARFANPLWQRVEYDRHLVVFMKIVVHDAFTQSCVEKSFRYVIKAVYGTDGERAAKFFNKVVAILENKIHLDDSNSTKAAVQEGCFLVCRLLHYTVRYNSDALGHADLLEVHASLMKLSNSIRTPLSTNIDRHLAETAAYLLPISINPKNELLHADCSISSLSDHYQQREFLIDLPGELSNQHPRHTNDSHLISKISILPTKDEVLCVRDPYLPINHISAPHFLDGPSRLFDINFRLLREDTIGPLRTAVTTILQKLHPGHPIAQDLKQQERLREPNIASTRLYYDVAVQSAEFDRKCGLQFRLRFRQPRQVEPLSSKHRADYWSATKSLDRGSLLCLISNAPAFQCFLTVVGKDLKLLTKDSHRCYVDVTFEGKDDDAGLTLLQHIRRKHVSDSLALVEFPGIFLVAYKTVLESLQSRSQHPFLPFWQILCPKAQERQPYTLRNRVVSLPPPPYTLSEGFRFDLQPLKHRGSSPEPLLLSLDASADDQELITRLMKETTLDSGQCKGLVAGLTQEMALIQGPPGTGKTYLGVELVKALLHNKTALGLKPIICVCYTNHALDQFLEHLLPVTKRIVRIGGMSKSEKLEQYNLHEWVKRQEDGTKTRIERATEYQSHKTLDSQQEEGSILCESLSNGAAKIQWDQISVLLKRNYLHHYRQFVGGVDDDGYVKVGRKRGNYFYYWKFGVDLKSPGPYEKVLGTASDRPRQHQSRSLPELLSPDADIWDFTENERHLILGHWEGLLRQNWIDELLVRARSYQDELHNLDILRSEYNRRLLEKVDIIGLTTTGLARCAPLLDRVEAKTLICEEAGEVLESHTLTALLPSIEHCILIGDHMQLRPKVQNHDLSSENQRRVLKYNLDISLFERLCTSGIRSTTENNLEFPFTRLTVQRRMQPDIADLIRRPLYPELEDHPVVHTHPQVPGMYHRLFWLDHWNREDGSGEFDIKGTSHSNDYEVEMVKQLVSHLSKQGFYKDGDLAVLTPYVGQLRKLRNELSNTFSVQMSEKDQDEIEAIIDEVVGLDPDSTHQIERKALNQTVRIATVDNFQGEEAKVIVVSLVRSNENGKVGFLKTPNRINVLLSRAQHGMYIIGDATCASTVKMWKDVVDILTARDQIGKTLRLRCPRHQDALLIVSKPDDFEVVAPEGGCSELCSARLECGHACEFLCHAKIRHVTAGCRKPCEKGRPICGHGCPKRCSEPCGKCEVVVKNVSLLCGHNLAELSCWKFQDLDKSQPRCTSLVKRKLKRCGHEVEMKCWESPDDVKCKKICSGVVECRHQVCINPCYKCDPDSGNGGIRRHAPCAKICDNDFTTCSHRCARLCHIGEDCGLCRQDCELRCTHSKCHGICGEQCVPCAEPCTWSCEHLGRCKMPCGAPCDRLPCNLRCSQILGCGHQCPSICGEICPSEEFCQKCCAPELKCTQVDYLEFKTYEEINLDKDPIIIPPCKHMCSRTSLDGILEIDKVYIIDENGGFVGSIPNGAMTSQRPQCPKCRSPISQVQRYNRVVNRSILDKLLQNLINRSQSKYLGLAASFEEFKIEMDRSREESLQKFRQIRHPMQKRPNETKNAAVVGDRLKLFDQPKQQIRQYVKEVDEARQPHMKVYKMSIAALSRANTKIKDRGPVKYWPLDVPSPDIKHRILGDILDLRLEICRYADLIRLANRLSSLIGCKESSTPIYRNILKKCNALRSKATKTKDECDQRQYYTLAVETILLHTELLALVIRASEVVDKPHIQKSREVGLQLLSHCDQYFINFESCRNYKTAVTRARELLRVAGPCYESVTQEERNTIYQAMREDFGASVRWYYCLNGHPFTVGECGRPMEETRCPECGEPVGGRNHNPASGVREAGDIY